MDIAYLCGGEGARLRPLTYAVPKPMLPIGPKPILEINIQRAKEFGFKRHLLMVSYKADVIREYFRDGELLGVEIQYFTEKERRGTAGPLFFLKDIVTEPFIVMNADILTDLNLKNLLKFHNSQGADLTVALKRVDLDIPYGVVKVESENSIESIDEKPTLEFLINSGIYVVSPELLDIIPDSGIYPMTSLITDSKAKGMTVLGYQFTDSWKDIGRLDDYLKALNGEDNPPIEFDSS
ncbi:MAG: sugar phosphate nucleotidyltransferase [Candidatus Sifarchaeia archaeon]